MAASTPSRPTLCIVPSNDVLLLAEELQGLGGNDIALAKSTVFDLKNDVTGAADEVARWLADGCSATTLAPGCDLELANTFIQHVVARMDSFLELALSWAHVSSTKAINCIGTAVPPVIGLRGAPAVRFSHLDALGSILQVVFRHVEQSADTILTLGVFNPADSTLASLNLVFCNGRESTSNLMELVTEVTELHAKGHPGEHILRSSRLGLLNHFAAPLIAGNARLFIPQGSCPPELENRIEVIKAVCTRAQVPATDLKWLDTQQYLGAAKVRQQQQPQAQQTRAQTPSAGGGTQQRTAGSVAGEASVERRRQQRARVSSSLQRAAALGAARLSSSSSVKFKLEEEGVDSHENGDAHASLSSQLQADHSNEVYKENQHQEQNIQQINEHEEEVSGSSSKPEALFPKLEQQSPVHRTALHVTKGIAELTSPSGAVCYGSPSPLPHRRPTSSSNKCTGNPGHTDVGGSCPGSKKGKNNNSISSYAAAFGASHPSCTPASLSPGKDGFGKAIKERSHQRGRPQERVPATAALQRRLWVSSTAMPPVTDVFQSESFAFGLGANNNGDANHQGAVHEDTNEYGDNVAELHFDLSEQAAAVAASVARARGDLTASYYTSQQQQEEHYHERHQEAAATDSGYVGESLAEDYNDKRDGEEDLLRYNNSNNAYEHTYSHYSETRNTTPHSSISGAAASATAAAVELAAELEKERRVNSVLFKQLQEAQERAAMATAAASSVPAMENLESGDFSGVLAALQHERLRNTELGQQAQQAAEAQLSLEVELASVRRENAITSARCRALEKGFPLAHVFAQCEAAVKSAEEKAQRLQKENSDLARAVAEAEITSLVKPALNRETNSSDTSAVIATLHKKLNSAHFQIRKLKDEIAAQKAKARAAESAVRGADVNRRTAEDAIRRNAALQEALTVAEARLEDQCLAAAEALAAAGELQREREEFVAALEAEQERNDQLLDLAESFRLRAQVGAAYASTSPEARSLLTSSATPAAVPSRAYC
ncbi:hypothetical protein Ndes2437B_g05456 [Nannochloris sp. 'desiccata']|nr:hypothetical protein KSW81_007468 [Chlorella desiccata (nom. nud.)]